MTGNRNCIRCSANEGLKCTRGMDMFGAGQGVIPKGRHIEMHQCPRWSQRVYCVDVITKVRKMLASDEAAKMTTMQIAEMFGVRTMMVTRQAKKMVEEGHEVKLRMRKYSPRPQREGRSCDV